MDRRAIAFDELLFLRYLSCKKRGCRAENYRFPYLAFGIYASPYAGGEDSSLWCVCRLWGWIFRVCGLSAESSLLPQRIKFDLEKFSGCFACFRGDIQRIGYFRCVHGQAFIWWTARLSGYMHHSIGWRKKEAPIRTAQKAKEYKKNDRDKKRFI